MLLHTTIFDAEKSLRKDFFTLRELTKSATMRLPLPITKDIGVAAQLQPLDAATPILSAETALQTHEQPT